MGEPDVQAGNAAPTKAIVAIAPAPDGAEPEKPTPAPNRLLVIGTWASVFLVFACIVGVGALCYSLMTHSFDGKSGEELTVRLMLSCVGCFIGLAFACLGFGLFLIQAQGAFEATGNDGGRSAQLKSSAPGLVVVVCATIVMWLSLEVHFTVTSEPAKGPAAMNAGGGSGAPDPAKDGVSMP